MVERTSGHKWKLKRETATRDTRKSFLVIEQKIVGIHLVRLQCAREI